MLRVYFDKLSSVLVIVSFLHIVQQQRSRSK